MPLPHKERQRGLLVLIRTSPFSGALVKFQNNLCPITILSELCKFDHCYKIELFFSLQNLTVGFQKYCQFQRKNINVTCKDYSVTKSKYISATKKKTQSLQKFLVLQNT